MTPLEKAIELLDKMNNEKIGYSLWQKSSYYAKKDLKRKASIVIDEIENVGCWVSKECAEKQGFGVESTQEFWQDVRFELEQSRNCQAMQLRKLKRLWTINVTIL